MKSFLTEIEKEVEVRPNLPIQYQFLKPIDKPRVGENLRISLPVRSDFYNSSQIETLQYYKFISKIFSI